MGAHLRNAGWRWTSPANRGNGVELMPVHKRTYRSRKTVWFYEFNLPGATRQDRIRVSGSGFATKKEAADAEVARQIEEQQKRDLAKAGASVVTAPPKTLAMLLTEFISQHAEEKLAPKTIERYREQVTYLHPDLVQMPLADPRNARRSPLSRPPRARQGRRLPPQRSATERPRPPNRRRQREGPVRLR